VSRVWRKEGERAFREVYLPILHIKWTELENSYIRHGLVGTPHIESIDPQSSTLSLLIRWSVFGTDDYRERFTREEWKEEAQWITEYDDYRLWIEPHTVIHAQAIWFDTADGRYTFVGSAETCAFEPQFSAQDQNEFPKRHVTCDWKALMDALFAEEMYVRQRRPGPSLYELAEQGIRDIFADTEQAVLVRANLPNPASFEEEMEWDERWEGPKPILKRAIEVERPIYREKVNIFLRQHCHHTRDINPVYAAAFQERLRSAFSKKGVDLYTHDSFTSMSDCNQQLDYNLEATGCLWLIESRLKRLRDFADGLGNRRFGDRNWPVGLRIIWS
jgi:hypothetical protein